MTNEVELNRFYSANNARMGVENIFLGGFRMENKINLEEMIFLELNRRIDRKVTLETKAVGSIASISLMLTILFQFIKELPSLAEFPTFKEICRILYILPFILGVFLLVAFGVMLLPRTIAFFAPDELLKLYRDKERSDDEKEQYLLKECDEYITASNSNAKNSIIIFLDFHKFICINLFHNSIPP